MSAHWRLALQNAACIAVLAAALGLVIWFVYGEAYAGAFFYGAGMGLVSIVSTALTVSLLMKHSYAWRAAGVATFAGRYGFAAGSLGIPAYLGLWPVVAMLGGFAGVYLIENTVLLPRVMGNLSVRRKTGGPVNENAERRAEI